MKTRCATRGSCAPGARIAALAALLLRVAVCVPFTGLSPAVADTVVPLNARNGFATYYLPVDMGQGMVEDYLVDTGAGFMTITESTLSSLENAGRVRFVRIIQGHLADGSVLRVPIYVIDEIVIGSSCVLKDVEAAVLPGASRGLFGLSALRRTSPFEFSMDPPTLRLSNCQAAPVLAASTAAAQ